MAIVTPVKTLRQLFSTCHGNLCIRMLAVIFAYIFSASTYAGTETFNARLSGSEVSTGSSFMVQDDKFMQMFGTSDFGFVNNKVEGRLILAVDQSSLKFQEEPYDITVTCKVTSYTYDPITKTSSSFTSTNVQLRVTYDPFDKNNEYQDKYVQLFPSAHKLEVNVIDVVEVNSKQVVNLSLEAEVVVDRVYNFNPTAILNVTEIQHKEIIASDELEVAWNIIPGAERYDLEWTFVDDYPENGDLGSKRPIADLKFDFRNNSTRVSLSENNYRIPLIFERGYILFRVRGVGQSTAVMGEVVTGEWSSDREGNVQGFSNYYYHSAPHEGKINWQYITNYAEEGKKKESVSYFDGSLRNQQVVSRLNTEKKSIVGETKYDYNGRAAIQVLPTPTLDNLLDFHKLFNLDESNADPFDRTDFDEDQSACEALPAGMGTSSGASQYYSPNNPLKDEMHAAYVPDAKKYPFIQIRYTRDNTGRISEQSGVGFDHKLGSGHETKYFYGKPFQEELDRLFGSDVGYAYHYKKNLVKDANGQYSVSYIDMEGRVIATALAGEVPEDENGSPIVDALDSYGSEDITIDLINKIRASDFTGLDNKKNFDDLSLTINSQMLVTSEATRNFEYQMNGQQYQVSCQADATQINICYDCVFDLTLNLTDECGNPVLPDINSDPDNRHTVDIGTFDAPSSICDGTPPSYSVGDINSGSFSTAPLKPGNYTLTKKLKLKSNVLEDYADHYIENNTCLLTLDDFLDLELDKIDTTACDITCDNCLDRLGSYDQYNLNVTPDCDPCLTQDEYDSEVKECEKLCETQSLKCEAALEGMLLDMTPPFGQYGQTKKKPGLDEEGMVIPPLTGEQHFPGSFPLSVFNSSNQLPKRPGADWRNPVFFDHDNPTDGSKTWYIDDFGNKAYVFVKKDGSNYDPPVLVSKLSFVEALDNGQFRVRPDYLQNVSDFLDRWEDSWATSLVIYHPEFSYLKFCLEIEESHEYDALWRYTNIIADAPVNFLDPLGSSKGSANDPYFKNHSLVVGSKNVEYDAMDEAMNNYLTKDGTTYTIWQAAYMAVHCPSETCTGCNCSTPSTCITTDDEWNMYKNVYLSLKQKFLERRQIYEAITNDNGYNGCIGEESFNPFENNFYQTSYSGTPGSQFFNPAQPCYHFNVHFKYYVDKVKRFPTNNDLVAVGAADRNICYEEASDGIFEQVNCLAKNELILEDAENKADRQLYESCGQCPLARDLQGVLQEVVRQETNGLATTTDFALSCNYRVLSKDLEDLFPGTGQVTWDYISNLNDELIVDFNRSGATPCRMHLFLPAGAQFTFDEIDEVLLLEFNPNPTNTVMGLSADNYFTLTANLVDETTQERTRVVVEGVTSCVPVTGCTFDLDCSTSMVAVDFQSLLNTLLDEGTLGSTTAVDLMATPYAEVITDDLEDALADATLSGDNNWRWKNETSSTATSLDGTLFDPVNTNESCNINIAFTDPTDATNNGYTITDIIELSNIRPDKNNLDPAGNSHYFLADALVPDGTTKKYVEVSGYSSCLNIGNCDDPLTPDCTFENREEAWELQALFNQLYFNGDFFNTDATSSGVDLTEVSNASEPLKNYGHLYLNSSLDQYITGTGGVHRYWVSYDQTNTPNKIDIFIGLSGNSVCNITLEGPASFSFASSLSGVAPFSGIEAAPLFGVDAGITTRNFELQANNGFTNTRLKGSSTCYVIGECNSEDLCAGEVLSKGYIDFAQIFDDQNGLTADFDIIVNNVVIANVQGTFISPDHLMSEIAEKINATISSPDYTARVIVAASAFGSAVYRVEVVPASGVGSAINASEIDISVNSSSGVLDIFSTPFEGGQDGGIIGTENLLGHGDGDFESEETDFATGYTFASTACQVDQHTLYSFANPVNPDCQNVVHPLTSSPVPVGKDHTDPGRGSFLLFGDVEATAGTVTAWNTDLGDSDPIAVEPNTDYVFTAWYKYIAHENALNTLTFYINGVDVGDVQVIDEAGVWKRFRVTWNSGSATAAEIRIDNSFANGFNWTGLDDISLRTFSCKGMSPTCEPIFTPVFTVNPVDECKEYLKATARINAEKRYELYVEEEKQKFREEYIAKCLNVYEEFFMKYPDIEHHYTLYYYDQAGNLARTVPDKGVKKITGSDLDQVRLDRESGTRTVFTEHTYPTTYTYNSLNQLVAQSLPDHDDMEIKELGSPNSLQSGQTPKGTQFFDEQNGLMIAGDGQNGYLYSTDDGGGTWTPITSIGTTDLRAVQVLDANTAMAVGVDGTFIKTTDGGINWITRVLGTQDELLTLHFASASDGVIGGRNGMLFITADGGDNWSPLSGVTGDVTGIDFTGANDGVISSRENGKGHLYEISTTDFTAANTTIIAAEVRTSDLADVHFITTSEGFAVGSDGRLLKTSNSGVNWQEIASGLVTDLDQVHFSSATTGNVLTSNGALKATDDGGVTWTEPLTGVADLHFISMTQGYAAKAAGEIRVTTDNGQTWSVLANSPAPGTASITAVYFANASTGYAMDDAGTLHRTTDGGATVWTTTNTGLTLDLIDIHFNGSSGVGLATDGSLLTTNDAGATWTVLSLGLANFRDMYFPSAGKGYAVNKDGKVAETGTDILTWQSLAADAVPDAGNEQATIWFDGSGNGYVAGQKGELHHTVNNGGTWTNQTNQAGTRELNGLDMADASTGYAAGADGAILKTADGGTTWSTQATGSMITWSTIGTNGTAVTIAGGTAGETLRSTNGGNTWSSGTATAGSVNDIYFVPGSSTGYMASVGGQIQKSTDNGATWGFFPLNTGTTEDLYGVGFTTTSTGYAVGNNGIIIKTTDGGSTWSDMTKITPPNLNAMHVTSDGSGTVIGVGDDGTILKSIDQGITWEPITSGTITDLTGVYFHTADKGTVIGKGGLIRHTDNAGDPSPVWTDESPATVTEDLNDIQFTSEDRGYIAGNNNTLAYWNGTAWQKVMLSVSPASNLKAIQFINHIGYAVGTGGVILKSTNEGVNWTELEAPGGTQTWVEYLSGTISNLNDVFFHDYTTGYVVGDDGVILKTINGGDTWELEISNTTDAITSINFSGEFEAVFTTDGTSGGATVQLEDMTDRFSTRFWYDPLGRLVASQNGRQFNKSTQAYSYTQYDFLGRITEVGELASNQTPDDEVTLPGSSDPVMIKNTPNFPNEWEDQRTEVTRTTYDAPLDNIAAITIDQRNLRNRVGAAAFYDDFDAGASDLEAEIANYRYATHYTYDEHGNVDRLLQEITDLEELANSYKTIDYKYDLVSGNVKEVRYQPGSDDQYIHRYEYDADNRITHVFTSRDGVNWSQDAKYFYYAHGPLARVEIGDNKVQAMDYAYTIQGWLKGVNSNTVSPGRDIGKDALLPHQNVSGINSKQHLNHLVTRDAFGYTLGYYEGDYSAVNTELWNDNPTQRFEATLVQGSGASEVRSGLIEARSDLFNGNISHMVTAIHTFDENMQLEPVSPQGMAYRYDQLNRIKRSLAFQNIDKDGNSWGSTPHGTIGTNDYETSYTYDSNGNILSLNRNAFTNNDPNDPPTHDNAMDQLIYYYATTGNGFKKNTNRLIRVEDSGDNTTAGVDFDDIRSGQSGENYRYDEIGNLIQDTQEEIAKIEWTVYGKVSKVVRTDGTNGTVASSQPDLEFKYDANGNRIVKLVKPRTNGTLSTEDQWKYTYYLRDASGNVMSTYTTEFEVVDANNQEYAAKIKQEEIMLYGSSRVGIDKPDKLLTEATFTLDGTTPFNPDGTFNIATGPTIGITPRPNTSIKKHALREKQFELSNHLGNVLTTVTDVKVPVSGTGVDFGSADFENGTNGGWTAEGSAVLTNPSGRLQVDVTNTLDGAGKTYLDLIPGEIYQFHVNLDKGTSTNVSYGILSGNTFVQGTLNQGVNKISFEADDVNALVSILHNTSGSATFYIDDTKLTGDPNLVAYNIADISSVSDYYPFGMQMPGRTNSSPSYRYGFNGQEKDDEMKGSGNSYDFGARIYDPRLGRFLSIDKFVQDAPKETPYIFAGSNPIYFVDANGNFKLSPSDAKTFPVFNGIIQNLSDFTDKNKDVFDAFVKNSGLTEVQAKEVLSSAPSSPLIEIGFVNGNAETDPKTGQIKFNKLRVQELEDLKNEISELTANGASQKKIIRKQKKLAKKVGVLLVGVLHEGVHHGDVVVNKGSTDNKPASASKQGFKSVERGEAFEKEAFGEEIFEDFIHKNEKFKEIDTDPEKFIKDKSGIDTGL